MTQTFTPATDFTDEEHRKEQKNTFQDFDVPSEKTIQNILNFSKNLEIKPSRLVEAVEFIRS